MLFSSVASLPADCIPSLRFFTSDAGARQYTSLPLINDGHTPVSEFAIFIGDGDDQMLFGCEIRDSYSVSYSFAACFVQEREKNEAAILYEIAQSDKIDDLTVVLINEEEEKRLKLQRGLDTRTLKKLRYYVLSGEE